MKVLFAVSNENISTQIVKRYQKEYKEMTGYNLQPDYKSLWAKFVKEFENIRANGKIAITLKENDELISVKKTLGNNQILIASSNGRMIRL